MIKTFKNFLNFVFLLSFFAAFVWTGSVHSYLDENLWHLGKFLLHLSQPLSIFLLLFSWFISFAIACVPFFLIGIGLFFLEYKILKQKHDQSDKEQNLINAKKAANLYINTKDKHYGNG